MGIRIWIKEQGGRNPECVYARKVPLSKRRYRDNQKIYLKIKNKWVDHKGTTVEEINNIEKEDKCKNNPKINEPMVRQRDGVRRLKG